MIMATPNMKKVEKKKKRWSLIHFLTKSTKPKDTAEADRNTSLDSGVTPAVRNRLEKSTSLDHVPPGEHAHGNVYDLPIDKDVSYTDYRVSTPGKTTKPDKPAASTANGVLHIPAESLTMKEKITSREKCEVWKGHTAEGTCVAIKRIEPPFSDKYNEEMLLRRCSHRNVIKLVGVDVSCSKYKTLVFDWMENGSLDDYIRKSEVELTTPDMIKAASQISCGMAFLERLGVVHSNLTTHNILVTADQTMKISGFSHAFNSGKSSPEGHTLPIKWRAPELMTGRAASIKTDVWSFGILLYVIVTRGGELYKGMPNVSVKDALGSGYRMPRPENCPEKLFCDMILACWREASDRPTFDFLSYYLDDFEIASEQQDRELQREM